MGRIRRLVCLSAVLGSCAALLGITTTASAFTPTASGPLVLDGPQNGSKPLVAYDPIDGVTFVAWSDVQAPNNGIELCVVDFDATGCAHGGPVLLSVSNAQNPGISDENPITLQGLTVASDGDVTVIGMAVAGGSIAWQSADDGSTFFGPGQGLQNGGDFISPVDPYSEFDNVVALGNADVGILDELGDYWSDSSIAGPESPLILDPNSNQNNGGLYNGQPLSDGPGVAAEPTPGVPGSETVVAVGDQFVGPNTTLPGCVNNQGTGYGVDVGTINGQSNAAGTLNQGIPAYQLLACSALNATLSTGASSQAPIGVLENEGDGISGAGKIYTVDYRPFNATATGGSFGPPVQLAQLPGYGGANDLALANDAGDGVYAYWYESGANYLDIDYSANGGKTWQGTEKISDPKFRQFEYHPSLTAVGEGKFDVAFNADPGTGTETYLERFKYQPMLPPVAASVAPTATSTSTMITTVTSCSVTPCTVTVTVTTSTTTVTPLPAAKVRAAGPGARKARSITLATGTFTLTKPGRHALKLHLNATGRRLIQHAGKLRATLHLMTKTVRGTTTSSHPLTIIRKK